MYEGRNAQLFHPTTGILTWMSHPAQPSFVWQLYHYDLEPNSSLFAVKKAAELVHIQFNEATSELQVINNLPTPLADATVHLTVYNLDGSPGYLHDYKVTAPPDVATTLDAVDFPAPLSSVYLIHLELRDATGKLLSTNLYWHAQPGHQDDFTDLGKLPTIPLQAQIRRNDSSGKPIVTVTLHNPSTSVALLPPLQLRRQHSGERVLPLYFSAHCSGMGQNSALWRGREGPAGNAPPPTKPRRHSARTHRGPGGGL